MLLNQAIMMTNTRPEYFGRVISWVFMAFGLQGILAPVWGIVADAIGGRETLYIVGLVVVAGTILMALSRARNRRIPPEPGTAAYSIAGFGGEQPPEPEPRLVPSEPRTAPSPAISPLFAARLAPVVLMEGQKPRCRACRSPKRRLARKAGAGVFASETQAVHLSPGLWRKSWISFGARLARQLVLMERSEYRR